MFKHEVKIYYNISILQIIITFTQYFLIIVVLPLIKMVYLTPKQEILQLIYRGGNLQSQLNNELSSGIHTNEAAMLGEFLVQGFIPHGYKGMTRKIGTIGQKTAKDNIKKRWQNQGSYFLSECESIVRTMSLKTKNLSTFGNAPQLLKKFNRVKKIKNPLPFFDNLIIVLQEFQSLDLIWNKDIEQEIITRQEIKEILYKEKQNLKINSKDIVKNLQRFDSVGETYITNLLKPYPAVLNSILGALERLQDNAPDAERHCISSCRASIESLCTKLGKDNDWKKALCNIFTSDTDRRQVKNIWNFLSGKGVHGGHNPTKKEAEYGFRLTVATLGFILHKKIE